MTNIDKTTVLVVDDDEDMRTLVKMQLEIAGDIEVVAEAIDGTDALEAFKRLDAPPVPEVVVLDNRMPGMTGLEVAERLLKAVPGQRILLFTAYLDDETVARAEAVGITEVVSKDQVAELPAILRRLRG